LVQLRIARDNLVARKTIFVPLLLETVNELHRMGIMHGDIKPQNILWKETGVGNYSLKLCDFDNSREFGQPFARDGEGNI